MICTYEDHAEDEEIPVNTHGLSASVSSNASTSSTTAAKQKQHHDQDGSTEQIVFPVKLHHMLKQVERWGHSHGKCTGALEQNTVEETEKENGTMLSCCTLVSSDGSLTNLACSAAPLSLFVAKLDDLLLV